MTENPSQIERQIEEKKEDLNHLAPQIESLRKERARIEGGKLGPLSRETRIGDLDYKILDLEKAQKNIPFQIQQLEERLKEAEGREKFDEGVLKSAPSLSEMQKNSKLLLLQLKAAQETSERLIAFRQQCDSIEKAINKQISRPRVSRGFTSLRLITAICEAQISGSNGNLARIQRWTQLPKDKHFI